MSLRMSTEEGKERGGQYCMRLLIGLAIVGGHRAAFMPYQLLSIRGLSVDSDSFIPWFRKLNEQASEMFPGETCEIHMDNARVHLYSADYNPSKTKHTKSSLLEEALLLMEEGEEIEELRPMLMEATKAELVRYIKCVAGKRTPEIFKIAREFGNIVERTPPYHPELQPIELIWSRLKAEYSRRYEQCRVAESLGSFSETCQRPDLSPRWTTPIK